MCLESTPNHPEFFSLWKNYLPQNPSIVPKGLRQLCVLITGVPPVLLKHAPDPLSQSVLPRSASSAPQCPPTLPFGHWTGWKPQLGSWTSLENKL